MGAAMWHCLLTIEWWCWMLGELYAIFYVMMYHNDDLTYTCTSEECVHCIWV